MVKNGIFNLTIQFLYQVKTQTDILQQNGLWEPNQKKNSPLETNEHPFAGCNSVAMNLISSLTYIKSQQLDDYFSSDEGKLRLGLILSYTKLDVDNPTLREWSLVVIRNICSWSERIRKDLGSLELIGVSDEGN